jgi:hypothetical protein
MLEAPVTEDNRIIPAGLDEVPPPVAPSIVQPSSPVVNSSQEVVSWLRGKFELTDDLPL